jgi:hypothetical protein
MGQARPTGSRTARLLVAASLCAAVIATIGMAPASASAHSPASHSKSSTLPLEGEAAAFLGVLTNPTASPPGANNWSCKPSAAHGSSFIDSLNSGGETVAGVKYVDIESIFDEVVTPYTNAFLPAASNVQNITLQDQCPFLDYADHISIIYDSNALQDIENALGADKASFQPSCAYVGAIIGDN